MNMNPAVAGGLIGASLVFKSVQCASGKAHLLLISIFCGLLCACSVTRDRPYCDDKHAVPHLTLNTEFGRINIALDRNAAPQSVAWILKLARSGTLDENSASHYEGIAFDHTQPRIEIISAERSQPSPMVIPMEIDADALGLDKVIIKDIREADLVLQMELLVARNRYKHSQRPNRKLDVLLKEWHESRNPEFLIGVSRKQINEALGYQYTSGLSSIPISKGTVALMPSSPKYSTSRLSISLTNRPDRTGQWTAVGKVVDGLDVADMISVQPLARPQDRTYQPAKPVIIRSLETICSLGGEG